MLINLTLFVLTSDTESSSNEKHNDCENHQECNVSEDWVFVWFNNQKEKDEEKNEDVEKEEERRKQEHNNEGWIRWFVRKFFGLFSGKATATEMTEDFWEEDGMFETEDGSETDE